MPSTIRVVLTGKSFVSIVILKALLLLKLPLRALRGLCWFLEVEGGVVGIGGTGGVDFCEVLAGRSRSPGCTACLEEDGFDCEIFPLEERGLTALLPVEAERNLFKSTLRS
jgi:hypothetical protein